MFFCKGHLGLWLFIGLCSLLASHPAAAQLRDELVNPPLDSFDLGIDAPEIRIGAATGSGCSIESVRYVRSQRQSKLRFLTLEVESGPGISLSRGRKNCLVELQLTPVANYQFNLVALTAEGITRSNQPNPYRNVSLSSYVEGFTDRIQTSQYLDQFLVGPFQVSGTGQEWSPCGYSRKFYINVGIRTSGNQSSTLLRADTLYLSWTKRPCG